MQFWKLPESWEGNGKFENEGSQDGQEVKVTFGDREMSDSEEGEEEMEEEELGKQIVKSQPYLQDIVSTGKKRGSIQVNRKSSEDSSSESKSSQSSDSESGNSSSDNEEGEVSQKGKGKKTFIDEDDSDENAEWGD